ncbi:OmpP1/FadL family transporter [Chthonobacter rhizosphaerae]|uniref:OmpP1/FadL family transporter n=1 Tax=Chthonobacter rhizosphaerae TaxID=2735553 RepID=UPI0015EF0959|nr:outer membrane protein transport protein [Chthonobacter rhizosphaerae]
MAGRAFKAGVAAAALMGAAGAVMVGSTGAAHAGAFMLREQSTYGQGASFAGVAAPGDSISSMYWNPAAVTTAVGLVFESNHTFISPHADFDPDSRTSPLLGALVPGDGGDLGVDAYLPSSYTAYQVNEDLYLGLSINTPFGLATHADRPWVGQVDHLRAKVLSVNVAPTIGYKINDQISIALGAQIQYFNVDLTRALLPTPTSPTANLSGDDFGFGFTAGVTFEPTEGTTIGLGFRSAIAQSLEGELVSPASPGGLPITADLTLPEMVTLGVRQRVNDQFTLLAGIEWTNWSRLGIVDVDNAAAGTVTELDFEYQDGWFFSLGAEYAWNDNLTLRSGLGYEISPVRDEFRSARLPDANRIWASVGFTYEVNERLSFDAAYTHLFGEESDINRTNALPGGLGLPATVTYAGSTEASADIVAVSLRYKLGG